MDERQLGKFVEESNRIEGILRAPTPLELEVTDRFLRRDRIELMDLKSLVKTISGADLRLEEGMNVRVGDHFPPKGGPRIKQSLEQLLERANAGLGHPYAVHQDYESLHPFMDGNGRSGRALWAWMMLDQGIHGLNLGFLHCWYYQSLSFWRKR